MMLGDVTTLLEGIQLVLFDHPSSLETMFVYHMISGNCCPARKLIGSQKKCLDQYSSELCVSVKPANSVSYLYYPANGRQCLAKGDLHRPTVQYMFI